MSLDMKSLTGGGLGFLNPPKVCSYSKPRHEFPMSCGAQCLIEVIRSSSEEMWRVGAYEIPYYSRGIEGEKRTHPRFADWIIITKTRRLPLIFESEIILISPSLKISESSSNESYRNMMKVRNQPKLRRVNNYHHVRSVHCIFFTASDYPFGIFKIFFGHTVKFQSK
jgi:hypothetical protein